MPAGQRAGVPTSLIVHHTPSPACQELGAVRAAGLAG